MKTVGLGVPVCVCVCQVRVLRHQERERERETKYHAGIEELYGTLNPRASIALAIVFAVYIPPHAPGPGQEL